ncbi:MAG: helix-turn-helix domain-containing protein [Selenomonas ruminantium]|uniref:Helix-turn-helix domain-containing protein n=1 Tax=Selenomonas ruminantium TaxID=971 RepID=A0A927WMT1_SELRU|nr:helix-turn-helix domain-containing protein [Selenomonas ruminantium]
MAEQRIIRSLHDRLAEALAMRHMKPIDLAKETDISRGAISQYVNGKVKPKQDKIAKMAAALRVSPTWLMGYDVAIDDTGESDANDKNTPIHDTHRERVVRRMRENAIRRRTTVTMEVSLDERELIDNLRSLPSSRIKYSIFDLVEMLAFPDLASLPLNSEISEVEVKEMIKKKRGELIDEPDDEPGIGDMGE